MTEGGDGNGNVSRYTLALLTFLLGLVSALGAAYFGYPKNLVTKEYFDLRMQAYDQRLATSETASQSNRSTIDDLLIWRGEVTERLRMSPAH